MNDQELEKILIQSLRLAKENNELLKKVNRRQKWARNWTVFYWVLLVGLAVTGYYFAFPYFQTVREQVVQFTSQVSDLVNFTNTPTSTTQ